MKQAIVHSAALQDRAGGSLLRSALFGRSPCLLKLHGDSGYRGPKLQEELKKVCRKINGGIAKRTEVGKFVVVPGRWGVGRTIGWPDRAAWPGTERGTGSA